MNALQNVLLLVLAISVLTFVALFGRLPALRRTPIGWLQRTLCLTFPNALRQIDAKLSGGQLTARSQRLGRYLFYEKNPIVLVIFLALLTGSAALFVYNGISKLDLYRAWPIPLVLFPPYYFTYKTATHDAHYITPANHADRLRDYPFDHVLFRPGNVCQTCARTKPARSKHCSLCNVCVAKADHHCPWVNNCLGRGNYRYFLALLLTLSVLQLYGAYLAYWILKPHMRLPANKAPLFTMKRVSQFGYMCSATLEAGGLGIAGVGLLAAATFTLPLGLLGYHLYLIWAGMTTNESSKWADWRDDMGDGLVFRAARTAILNRNSKVNRHAEAGGVDNPRESNGAPRNDIVSKLGLLEDVRVRWPVGSDQVVVHTRDGRPPIGQEALWTRIWNLGEVENIYDLGAWQNFDEVLKGH